MDWLHTNQERGDYVKYHVLDNGKPASMAGFSLLKAERWANHIFSSFEEAQAYARRWLGSAYESAVPSRVDFAIDYNGAGDLISIESFPELADEVEFTGTHKDVAAGTLGCVDVVSREDPKKFWVATACGGFMGWCDASSWRPTGKRCEVPQVWLDVRR